MAGAHVTIANRPENSDAPGLLFNGIKFWISKKCPLRKQFEEDVERNGGEVVQLEQQADLRIVDHFKDRGPQKYSYEFITDCLKDGQLKDIGAYELSSSSHRRTATRAHSNTAAAPKLEARTRQLKSTRTPFTAEEDRILYDFVTSAERRGERVLGNEIYKLLEAAYPSHTYQSWLSRWYTIRNRPRPGPRSTQPSTESRQQLKASESEEGNNEESIETEPLSVPPKRTRLSQEKEATVTPANIEENNSNRPALSTPRNLNPAVQDSRSAFASSPGKSREAGQAVTAEVESQKNGIRSEPSRGVQSGKHSREEIEQEPRTPKQPRLSKPAEFNTPGSIIYSQSPKTKALQELLKEFADAQPPPTAKGLPSGADEIVEDIAAPLILPGPSAAEDIPADFAAELPAADLEVPEPEGGWEAYLNPSEEAASEIPQGSTNDEDTSYLIDEWINSQVTAGYEIDKVLLALKCTSMQADLAQLVLDSLKDGHGIPPDIPGVFNQEEDSILEGGDGRKLRQMEEKHGAKAFNLRLEFLEAYRNVD